MLECSNCIMNNSISEFSLYSDGKCNFCHDHDTQKKKFTDFTEIEEHENLENLKNKIQNSVIKKNNKYNCLIGLSGGTDSSYVVYLAWKLKLNPLIIHMDNGWNSKISNQNINKILEMTGFDYQTLILDWEEFKDLQISFLKAGVPDIELLTDHAIFAYILNYSIKNNIPNILSGVNFATEHAPIPSWGWRKDDFNHINKIHKRFGKKKITTFPKMYPLKKIFYEKLLKKVNYFYPLDLINYNSTNAKKKLIDIFGWEDYGGKHFESFFTKFFQGYILPKKFNIDKRILHLSCMIRNNEITRDEAKEIISMPYLETQRISEYINYFKKKLGLTDETFNGIMVAKPKKHSDYDFDFYNTKFAQKIKNFILND